MNELPYLLVHLDAQTVVDIYINYDCDLSLHNVFEKLVNDLSRIAQGRHAMDLGAAPHQEGAIRVKVWSLCVGVWQVGVVWWRWVWPGGGGCGKYTQEEGSLTAEKVPP